MNGLVCPKGHQSSEPDYCSECGAKMVEAAAAPVVSAGAEETACPKCGTVREDRDIPFCEACGYNFETKMGGAEHAVAAAAPVLAEPAAAPVAGMAPATSWRVMISVDAGLLEPDSPEPPADFQPFTYALDQAVSLIGRRSVARAIEPEIALSYDEAVSHRHALLQLDGDGGLQLRDIGSSNGTRLNGRELRAMVDYPLKDGDEITLGHWSRITVKAVQ